MKVIIDTNVLVSAVLKGREPRDVIQFVVDSPNCDWVVSEEILAIYDSSANNSSKISSVSPLD